MSGYEYRARPDTELLVNGEPLLFNGKPLVAADLQGIPVDPPVRYEGNTAYVQTARQAMHVADEPCVSYVVVEDPAERIKLQRFVQACIKGIRV